MLFFFIPAAGLRTLWPTLRKFSPSSGKRNIIRQLLQEYDIETAEDIQDALKGKRKIITRL